MSEMALSSPLTDIVRGVAERYHIPIDEILSDNQTGRVAAARMDAYYWALRDSGLGVVAIARFFARDHATVIKGARRWARLKHLPPPKTGRAVPSKLPPKRLAYMRARYHRIRAELAEKTRLEAERAWEREIAALTPSGAYED